MSTQARPLQGEPSADPALKPGIVWVASFPKSGNTWTRTFLHNLAKIQSGEDGDQDINRMGRFSTWEINKDWYRDVLGFEPSNDRRHEIAAARPKVQELIADTAGDLVFVKTHHALVMDRGYPTINSAVTSGAIYIVRNPLDVAISYAHHMNASIDQAIEHMAMEDVETPGTDKATYEIYGSWSQHVFSWTRTPHRALHIMRYEDMVSQPEEAFGALARHLLLNPTPEELREAIERSSFDKLRAQEQAKGFREKPKAADKFFREGRAGQWKEALTPEQVDRIVRDHGEQMQRFGYLPLE